MYSAKHILFIFIILLTSLLASTIQATVIDFEAFATPGNCNVSGAGQNIGGFTIQGNTAGINSAIACSSLVNGANSGQNIMVNFNSQVGTFQKNLGTFDLNSTFVHADTRQANPTTVRFQGLDDIGNVVNSLEIQITAIWQQVTFNWTGIKTFTWDSIDPGSSNISIDDFTFNEALTPPSAPAVPEPSTYIFSLMALAFIGMRKKHS